MNASFPKVIRHPSLLSHLAFLISMQSIILVLGKAGLRRLHQAPGATPSVCQIGKAQLPPHRTLLAQPKILPLPYLITYPSSKTNNVQV